MAIVLTQVVELKREMPIKLFCHTCVGAVANPGGKVCVVKKFVTDKPVKIVPHKRMFDLEPMARVDEIQPWLAPVIFKPVAIAGGKPSKRKFESCFQRESLLFASHRRGGLVFKMCIEREEGHVLS